MAHTDDWNTEPPPSSTEWDDGDTIWDDGHTVWDDPEAWESEEELVE